MPETAETRQSLLVAYVRFKKQLPQKLDHGFLFRLSEAVYHDVVAADDPQFREALVRLRLY